MNKKFCIANWKMYLNNNESISYVKSFVNKHFDKNVEVVLCPSYVSIKDNKHQTRPGFKHIFINYPC